MEKKGVKIEPEIRMNKVQVAIALLQAYEPPEGYYLAFSGGKDSVVIYDLAAKAGVKFDAHYCVSPIDPPQIYKFIKEFYPSVTWDNYAKGFWKLVVKKGLPMRQSRWCCQVIKEAGGKGRVVVVGNRRAEGGVRRNQKCFEVGTKDGKSFLRPIIDFDNKDIWQYINENHLPYCELYNQGFKRIGCVLCPFSQQIEQEELRFPKVVAIWKRVCEQIVAKRKANNYLTRRGKPYKYRFETGEELYQWWVRRR